MYVSWCICHLGAYVILVHMSSWRICHLGAYVYAYACHVWHVRYDYAVWSSAYVMSCVRMSFGSHLWDRAMNIKACASLLSRVQLTSAGLDWAVDGCWVSSALVGKCRHGGNRMDSMGGTYGQRAYGPGASGTGKRNQIGPGAYGRRLRWCLSVGQTSRQTQRGPNFKALNCSGALRVPLMRWTVNIASHDFTHSISYHILVNCNHEEEQCFKT